MIFDDTQCQLGEGPLWHPLRKQLFWFDILEKRLHTKGHHWQFDDYVSAAGWTSETTLMFATSNALRHFDIATGAHHVIVPLEAENDATRSNDGRADPQGGFWIGTMGIDAEDGAGAIYRYYKGEVRQLFAPITISNAICFSANGKTAYFTDTPTQQIMRVALDTKGWPVGDPVLHIDLQGTDFRPDGAVVDAAGNLWNAQWGVGRVAAYDPAGIFIESFSFAAKQTSCPAFGGDDFSTLFCTSAAVGQDGPEQGKTFCAKIHYKGQAEHQVIL
ncbi:SMP-30/gluconolactonase/LRE family protein [Roseobacter sp. CCS2]|uniref:SMP-30/gluconolactonase/LRE family protein n=1 Tax=Roseobacter sp. CCS2 TaxID=391593 RepID=UPI0000F400F6|nr:SMP-30/gluconolactonase/LRE family protein [Roseobacter sp. CCS2]EBA13178.1 SMP-30/Gluconolaconase/LRE-like region [Roseobacter sp. CCS2]